jgi:hypothetical protein
LLADMPFGMGRRRTVAVGEVGCGQARFQPPSVEGPIAVTLKLSNAPSYLLGFFQINGIVAQAAASRGCA